jgi:RimJ/RimL family protein N-acetyltransferase
MSDEALSNPRSVSSDLLFQIVKIEAVPSTSGQTEVVAQLKLRPDSRSDCVPVLDSTGCVIGRLKPFNEAMARDADLAADLCRWRENAMTSFLTVFPPSVAATQSYLQGLMLQDPHRILFLIEAAAGERIGNVGLCNLTPGDVELDNVLRGEDAPVPGFMPAVQATLARWVGEILGCSSIYLNVIGSNVRAIRAYERAGFERTGTTPLRREPMAGAAYKLTPCAADAPGRCAELVRMEASIATILAKAVA